jgi:uncharacterized protein HemY
LGVALYRTGAHADAAQALRASMKRPGGGDAVACFFRAMAHARLGEQAQARKWYDRAVDRMENRPELRRFRAEAEELLGIDTNDK